jgi:hypothetical protein
MKIKQHGWSNPDPVAATQQVILPMTVGLLGMLLLPPLSVLALRQVWFFRFDERVLCMYSDELRCRSTEVLIGFDYSDACISQHLRRGGLFPDAGDNIWRVVIVVAVNQG